MNRNLRTFQELVKDLAQRYGIQEEVIEDILVEWVRVLYFSTTGREPEDDLPKLLR